MAAMDQSLTFRDAASAPAVLPISYCLATCKEGWMHMDKEKNLLDLFILS